MTAPDHEWLRAFLAGPLSAYLAGEISYGRLVEVIREMGCECAYSDLYPVLFNVRGAPLEPDGEDDLVTGWDLEAAAEDWFGLLFARKVTARAD